MNVQERLWFNLEKAIESSAFMKFWIFRKKEIVLYTCR